MAGTAAVVAAASAALNRRAQEIGSDIKAHSTVLMNELLSAFETAAKQMLREGFGDSSSKPAALRASLNP